MAKYRKFYYSAGYVGTDTTEIMKFDNSATDKEIEGSFEDWVEEQHSWSSDLTEMSEEEAEGEGIDEEY